MSKRLAKQINIRNNIARGMSNIIVRDMSIFHTATKYKSVMSIKLSLRELLLGIISLEISSNYSVWNYIKHSPIQTLYESSTSPDQLVEIKNISLQSS